MNFALAVAVILLGGIVQASHAAPRWNAGPDLADLVVSLNERSQILESANKLFEQALTGIHATAKASPRSEVLKSGEVVLWGNLFQTGTCFALAELPSRQDENPGVYGVAFAEWTSGKWRVRGLWKIPTVWRPKGWKGNDKDFLPITPTTHPFELRDLSNDGVPEVIIAGEVEKYYQEHYLLHFSTVTHTLNLVAAAMRRPELKGKFVRLYFNSGRRAIYEEWQFLKWEGEELRQVAYWHDEVGYHENDPTFWEGERTDLNGRRDAIRIVQGNEPEEYLLERAEAPFGRMLVRWKDQKRGTLTRSGDVEKAWLFQKTTGLPRRFYPGSEGKKEMARLENLARVTVEGNAEAAKFFSTAR